MEVHVVGMEAVLRDAATGGQLRQPAREQPASRRISSPRDGRGAPMSSSSSARTRSIASAPTRSLTPASAARVSSSGSISSTAARRATRSGRSASSRKRASGSPTARSVRLRMSRAPPCGSSSRPSAIEYANAFTVRSRRARSSSTSRVNHTWSGRRTSLYSPSRRNVVTSSSTTPSPSTPSPSTPSQSTSTVPWRSPTPSTRGNTARTSSGVRSLATSQRTGLVGACARPSRTSRTEPPTSQARARPRPGARARASGVGARRGRAAAPRRAVARPRP
jgi:hypothetical protein